ncbi:MAG: carbohydrate ABC transporter substrate-binding protein [Dactylosporangium sp.]|nr:ABC transporter substrate-binding protein [Dactylosporangium sp.]NNJ59791.1 carbohydrate ABC transporter substrate-binding protein [Dactylosporangium sp.]
MTSIARRSSAAVAAVAVALLLGVGCSTGGDGDSGITLVVADYGNSGFKALLRDYHQAHPRIRVVEHVGDYHGHHEELAEHLDEGDGAADIVGIDESYLPQFRDRPEAFLNLLDFGAGELKSRWLGWKWQQSLSADGTVQIGLGTDVGSLAVCYRRDLFAGAGLPTSREEVASLWPTWEAYIEAGHRFEASGSGAHWLDSSARAYNAIVAQQEIGYYDWDGNVVLASNAGVRQAFDLSTRIIVEGLSGRLRANTAPWAAAMRAGTFATMMCPAWGLGQLQQNAPDTRGKWDLTAVPGGGGNSGGSFLAIPKQTKHAKEAYQLATWLTAPNQQLRIFKETGNLPSQPGLYTDPSLREVRNEFVNNAPVGQIFGASAERLRPQYLGPKTSIIRAVIEDTLVQVESGAVPGGQAWATALSEASAAIANGPPGHPPRAS